MTKENLAQFMKSFANPLRLQIIDALEEGELSVNEIVERTGAKQCYVSQQLNYLSQKGILERRANRHHVYYSLRNKTIINMLNLVQISFEGEKIEIN